MAYCNAGSLSLHNQSVIDCLGKFNDIITYADGSVPAVSGKDNRPTTGLGEPAAASNRGEADPALRGTIADMTDYYHSNPFADDYERLLGDPEAKDFQTKYAVALGLYRRGNTPPNDWLYNDNKYKDIKLSCRWFQTTFEQIRVEYPDLSRPVLAPHDSDEFAAFAQKTKIAAFEHDALVHAQNCPTEQQRLQQRAQLDAEKKEKDEAALREHMSCRTSLRRCP